MSFRANESFAVKSICDKLCPSELHVCQFLEPKRQGLIAIKNAHIS